MIGPGWEQRRKFFDEERIQVARNVLVNTLLEQRALGSGINDRSAELAEIANGSVDDIDGFMIRLGEQALVHVFSQDADPDAFEAGRSGIAWISLFGNATEAMHGQVVRRIVTGDDAEHLGDVFDGAARCAVAIIERTAADHPIPADQPLRLRQTHAVVEPRRHADRRAAFFRDRAGHQVRCHRRSGAAAGAADITVGCIRVAHGAAESAAAAGGIFAEIRLRQDDRARIAQAFHQRRVARRAIVGIIGIGTAGGAHVVRVDHVLDAQHNAVQRSYQLPRLGESGVERGRHFERVGHVQVVVDQIRHAAGFAIVETPLLARGGPQIQRHQGVEGSGMRNRRDRPENSFRFIYASSVVGLDPGRDTC